MNLICVTSDVLKTKDHHEAMTMQNELAYLYKSLRAVVT